MLTKPSPRELARWTKKVDHRLVKIFGEPHLRGNDPVAELVGCILSQATTDVQSSAAYDALIARYPTWEQIKRARHAELARVIHRAGLANEKARYIKGALQFIERERGEISLDFLKRMPPAEGRAWLTQITGVGPKTASIVLLFALKLDAFPVDTHIYRVSRRLGWIDARTTANQAHDILGPVIPAARKYPLHVNLIRLGREICTARVPHCERCPLTDLCNYYQTIQKPKQKRHAKLAAPPLESPHA